VSFASLAAAVGGIFNPDLRNLEEECGVDMFLGQLEYVTQNLAGKPGANAHHTIVVSHIPLRW
jgi:hypothetical protein